MSIFHPALVACRACGTKTEIARSASVNADRRPDLRAAILDGSFQAADCPKCGTMLRLAPHLTYMDLANGLWIVAAEASGLEGWPDVEDEARGTYAQSFGAGAPAIGQELGEGLKARLVFGWPALREKLHCSALGLDDVTLELVKMAIMRNVDDAPIADETELRLVGGAEEVLEFAWVVTETEEELSGLEVPRDIYDGIAGDPAWVAMRDRFDDALLVDLRRFIAGPELAAAEAAE